MIIRVMLCAMLCVMPSVATAHDPGDAIAEATAIAREAHEDAKQANALRREAEAQRDDAREQRDTCLVQRDTARQERDHCAGELSARLNDVRRLTQANGQLSEDNARLSVAVKRLRRSRVVLAIVAAGVGVGAGAFFVMWARP